MKLVLHRYDLPLRHTFTISRGSTNLHHALIVELQHEGYSGYGEAGANAYYGVSIKTMESLLEEHRPTIESRAVDDPSLLWEEFRPLLETCPFAQCALDVAYHDLWGKLHGQPLWKLWGLELDDDLPLTDYTIGIDTLDGMVAKFREFAGWPIYKIKLGTPSDLEIVRALRDRTNAIFRVDVNGGWTADETIALSPVLERLGVELIEQPLPPEDWAGMEKVFEQINLPIIADESCCREVDIDRCVGFFHGINIKLIKCGGITPARRMVAKARELGLRVMMGCMTESTVGISAIAQFLPLLDYVDMDGPLLLAKDTAEGVQINHGHIVFPPENGCGTTLYR